MTLGGEQSSPFVGDSALSRLEQMREDGLTARYAGFWVRLDCSQCGDYFEIEGDISNYEEVECDYCGASLVVENR